MFPGRTEKGIATKLRTSYPEIYYRREGEIESEREDLEPDNHREDYNQREDDNQQEDNNQHGDALRREEEIGRQMPLPSAAGQEPANLNPLSPPPQPMLPDRTYTENVSRIHKDFEKLKRAIGRTKKLIQKFFVDAKNKETVDAINTVLRDELTDIQSNHDSETTRRRKAKDAIYAAGILLGRELKTDKRNNTQPQKYTLTEKKIKKLEGHLKIALRIRDGKKKGLTKTGLKEIRIIKKLKLTIAQYISSTNLRLKILRRNLAEQKRELDSTS